MLLYLLRRRLRHLLLLLVHVLNEQIYLNNNNNNFSGTYQSRSDCDSPHNQMSSSEMQKKFHRANRVFYNGFLNKQDKPSSLPEYQAHASELLHFLKSLWVTNTMCDLSIVIGNRKYAAHRLGLAMFSRKYRDEFQKQLQAKDSGLYTICLQNTSHSALEAILKYIYTAKIDVNPSNVEEILAAAKELGIDDLICMASDYLSSLSIGDVLDFMGNMFNKEGSELMFYELYAYMMTHLDKISRTPEYCKSSMSVVKALLNDSHLCTASELDVFDAAIKWINFDRTNRLKYLGEVMRNIRFTLMTPDELVSKVENSAYFKDNFEIQRMLYNAYKFHALSFSKSNLNGIIHREESRNFSLKGASVPDEFVKAVVELSKIAHKLKETRTYTTSNLMNYNDECNQAKNQRCFKGSNRNNNNNNNNCEKPKKEFMLQSIISNSSFSFADREKSKKNLDSELQLTPSQYSVMNAKNVVQTNTNECQCNRCNACMRKPSNSSFLF